MVKFKFRQGKKGEGLPLSFSGRGVLALFLILILIFAYGKGVKPAYAVGKTLDKTLEQYGLNLADFPEILTLKPDMPPSGKYEGALVASWTLNKDAERKMSKAGADYKVEFLYKASPDDPAEDICTVYLKGSKTTPKAGFNVDCHIIKSDKKALLGSGFCGKSSCKNAPPGGYKIRVSFEPEDEQGFIGERETNYLYTEEYVELLNNQIRGCFDGFGDCNVIECKKQIINFYLENPLAPREALQLRKELVVEISGEFRKERGHNLPNKCGTFESVPGGKINLFKFDGCTDKDIDELNIKVARARLLEAAFGFTGQAVKSEDDYEKQLDQLDLWKKEAVDMTMSCARTWNRATTIKPKGALSEMEKLGWAKVGNFDKQEAKIKAELGRVLKEKLAPAIGNLRAEFGGDKSITLRWNALGYGSIDRYEVVQCWRKYARDEYFVTDRSGVELGGEDSSCYPLTTLSGDAEEASFSAARSVPGMHTFTLKAIKKDGGVIEKSVKTGLFTDSYVEHYKGAYGYPNYVDKTKRGIISVCVRNLGATRSDNCDNGPNPGDGNLAECNEACDVFEKKRSDFLLEKVSEMDAAFKREVTVRDDVFKEWKRDKITMCDYKKFDAGADTKSWELDDCSPQEVSELYDALVKNAYPSEPWAGFYSCTPEKTNLGWELNWKITAVALNVKHEDICKAKAELAKNLGNSNTLGWVYSAS